MVRGNSFALSNLLICADRGHCEASEYIGTKYKLKASINLVKKIRAISTQVVQITYVTALQAFGLPKDPMELSIDHALA